MRHFLHPNGSVESTPVSKRKHHEMNDIINHDDNVSQGVNRLAYKADHEQDPYKYKFYEVDEED